MLRAAALCCLVSLSTAAAELEGIKMPDSVTIDGKTLKLNGIGARTKGLFKVYVAGLYLEKPSTDADAIIATDGARRLDLTARRDMPSVKVFEAIDDAIHKSLADKADKLSDRLEKFAEMVPDTRKGETMSLVYVPAKGLTVSLNGAPRGTIEGKDFADAVFSAWLGKSPVEENLKKALVGAK